MSLVPIANAPINTPITDWERKTLASISNKPIIGEMADFFFLVRLMDYSDRDLQAKLAFTERLATFRPNDFVLFRRAVYLTYAGRDDEALDCIKLAYYNNIESIRAMVAYYNESGADPRLAKIRERLMNYYQEYQNRLKK